MRRHRASAREERSPREPRWPARLVRPILPLGCRPAYAPLLRKESADGRLPHHPAPAGHKRLPARMGGSMSTRTFTPEEALEIGARIGIDWERGDVDPEQFRMGLAVELEHGTQDPLTDVTHDDEIVTGKIALAHLREIPDYYTRLSRMEA